MLAVVDKKNCCGCGACGDICPKQAITFKADEEGFWYPEVDKDKCVGCHLCEIICPLMKEYKPQTPRACYSAVNINIEERMASSSGGLFSLLIKRTIEDGGVVFGAAFDDNWMVRHSSADSIQDAYKFKGSKYVQSKVEGCYVEVRELLKNNRKVLFSGTACQIAALNSFLEKEYDNLLTVDVVCHGVPSPGIWNDYLKTIKSYKKISKINFRDKSTGWRNYSFSVDFSDGSKIKESHYSNTYMQGFLHDLYLRPSCHYCKFKEGKGGSDITLGDFWGIEKVNSDMDDNNGVSVVLVNTMKGEKAIKHITPLLSKVTYTQSIKCNSCIVKFTPEKKWRQSFWKQYGVDGLSKSVHDVISSIRPSLSRRIINSIKWFIKYR